MLKPTLPSEKIFVQPQHQPGVYQYSHAQLWAWLSIGLGAKYHSVFLPVNQLALNIN